MQFLWPKMLWLLAAIPLLAAGYLLLMRGRRRRALAIGPLMARIGVQHAQAGASVGARLFQRFGRHLPAVLLGLAIAIAILASARPSALVTLPSRQQTVILAIDVSLSMRARDIEPNRLEAAQAAAKSFVQDLPADLRVGIISFAGTASLVQPPTRNRDDLVAAIDRFELQRHTATGSAIMLALATLFPEQGIEVESALFGSGARRGALRRDPGEELRARPPATKSFEPVAPGSYTSAAIVLLTDGRRTTGADPIMAAEMAAERGVRVFTVGFGTPQGASVDIGGWSIFMRLDEEALKTIAEITRAEYHQAGSEADLRKVYQHLSSRLVLERTQTEITAFFSAAAALLALLSAGLSVAWYGRIA